VLFRSSLHFWCSLDDADDSEEQSVGSDKTEIVNTVKELTSKMEDLTTCNNLIVNHGTALQRVLAELEHLDPGNKDSAAKIKAINERATLFRITASAMINVSCSSLSVLLTASTVSASWVMPIFFYFFWLSVYNKFNFGTC